VKKRSILAFLLFLYDCVRLGCILSLGKGQGMFSFLSVNVLFPIAGLFLFTDPERYREYGPLYAAGKAVGVFAGVAWLFFLPENGPQFSFWSGMNFNYAFWGPLILIAADILSLFVRLSIHAARQAPPVQSVPPPEDKKEPFQSAGDVANCE
jgi:hypothetical protein